jgi:hypothetical protein
MPPRQAVAPRIDGSGDVACVRGSGEAGEPAGSPCCARVLSNLSGYHRRSASHGCPCRSDRRRPRHGALRSNSRTRRSSRAWLHLYAGSLWHRQPICPERDARRHLTDVLSRTTVRDRRTKRCSDRNAYWQDGRQEGYLRFAPTVVRLFVVAAPKRSTTTSTNARIFAATMRPGGLTT